MHKYQNDIHNLSKLNIQGAKKLKEIHKPKILETNKKRKGKETEKRKRKKKKGGKPTIENLEFQGESTASVLVFSI